MMNVRWKVGFLGVLISIVFLGSVYLGMYLGNVSNYAENIIIDHQINKVFGCTDANKLFLTENDLYLRNGDKNIVLFENDQNKTEFQSDFEIAGFVAINRSLVISTGFPCFLIAVTLENQSQHYICSNISLDSTGKVESIGIYDHYVYTANYEWGFPIFDYSTVSSPQKVGSVPLGSWHSYQLYIVDSYGLFSGDLRAGIFELDENPAQPTLVITTFDHETLAETGTSLTVGGRPAISSKYFVLNHIATTRILVTNSSLVTEYIFTIVPRDSLKKGFDFEYTALKGYTHCVMIEEDIFAVSGDNNTLSFFKIVANQKKLELISTIVLDEIGMVKDLCKKEGTNELYIADGENGLLKLTVSVSRSVISSVSSTFLIPNLAPDILLLVIEVRD